MSQTPSNMDMNHIKAILNKSKTIMNTVDGGQYKRGNIDKSLLEQGDLLESVGQGQVPTPKQYQAPQNYIDPNSEAYKNKIQSSKMPDAVKQAMLKNPIAPPDMSAVMGSGAGRSFTLEDLGYTKNSAPQLNEQQTYQPAPQQYQPAPQQYQQPPQQYYAPQPPQQQTPSISRDEIKSIIKECLAEMMVNTISEHTVKNTIKTLMNEGKIRVKKKQ